MTRIVSQGGSGSPTGPAGGDLAGTYPNPEVIAIEETSTPARLAIGAIADGDLLARSGTSVVGVDGLIAVNTRIVEAWAGTTAALPTYTVTGGPGPGETLTATALGAFPTLDGGISLVANDPVRGVFLLHHAVNKVNNGVYMLIQQGDAGTPWIAVRSVYLDTALKITGSLVRVAQGRQKGGAFYGYQAVAAVVMGTTNLFWWRIDRGPSVSANEISQFIDDDFLWGGVNLTTPNAGTNPWGLEPTNSGTGSTESVFLAAGSATRFGVLTLRAGTTTTGRALMSQAGGTAGIILGENVGFRLQMKVGLPILSDGTDTFSVTVGLTDATGTAAPNNGVALTFQPAKNATNWLFTTATAGTPTDTNTTRTIVAGTDDEVLIVKDPGDPTCYMFMNGVLVGSGQSTNVPATAIWLTLQILKSAGTTAPGRDLEIDELKGVVFTPLGRAA